MRCRNMTAKRSSPSSVMPSPSRSRQIDKAEKSASAKSITPSWLVSSSARWRNPFVCPAPVPKSSRLSSMTPLPLRSNARRPSSAWTQPVSSANPSTFRSNRTPDAPSALSSIPSPSRSTTNGDVGGEANASPTPRSNRAPRIPAAPGSRTMLHIQAPERDRQSTPTHLGGGLFPRFVRDLRPTHRSAMRRGRLGPTPPPCSVRDQADVQFHCYEDPCSALGFPVGEFHPRLRLSRQLCARQWPRIIALLAR